MEERFKTIFDEWAEYYDDTVYDENNEYTEVFDNYHGIFDKIAESIADKSSKVLEIGTGTGNLLAYLKEKGFDVVGLEPSKAMREVALKKNNTIKILEGHFLDIPIEDKVDAIVTSYAFHHLNYLEKEKAIQLLDEILTDNGRIIIADTMFESVAYKNELFNNIKESGAINLYRDLNTEYYELLDDILKIFLNLGYKVDCFKMNKFVWVVSTQKNK